jgi:RimJ/RimL family protein N-acetyltransferase
MKPPRLNTTRFVIRAFELKDLHKFAQYRAMDAVAKYQSWSNYSYQDALRFFDAMDYGDFGLDDSWFQLAIATHDADELVGDLAIHFIDEYQVEIGFTLAPEHQGKNAATEAVTALLSYVFNELNKHRVTAITDVKNIGSYKLLEKLAFRREGHYIENVFFKGAWGDEYHYALLASEFRTTQQHLSL